MPLLFAASVLPDVDLLLRFIQHRGPTHSIIIITSLMIPFFVYYRKKAIPYYAALLSHILIGDFFTGGIELFWPLSNNMFGALNFEVYSLPIALTELILFLFTLSLMYELGDLKDLLKPNDKSWILIIPLGSIIAPLIWLGRGQENTLPTLLVIPSLIYIGMFAYSIYVWLKLRFINNKTTLKQHN
jgi:membrane-bound metal-dependent hydrolase YbcI (DUF457 family)